MWIQKLITISLFNALCFSTLPIVNGIEEQRSAEKACEEFENDDNFSGIQDPLFNVAVIERERFNSNLNTSYYGCAGVLIAEKFVLTAGHCVSDSKSIAVILGLPQTYDNNAHSTSIYMSVKAINIHPAYKIGNYSNDIAVLELENEIHFTNDTRIYPICLQTSTADLVENTKLFGSGIQRDENRKLILDKLLKGSAEIVSSTICNKTLGETDDTRLCVMDSEEICESISGSALVMITKDASTGKTRQRLVGIKVAGFPCVYKKLKIYTKISAHLDFIENIVWPKHE